MFSVYELYRFSCFPKYLSYNKVYCVTFMYKYMLYKHKRWYNLYGGNSKYMQSAQKIAVA